MVGSEYKIIAVDNEEGELVRIENVFKELRVPCLPIEYHIGDHLEEKFSNIRIAFFDINFSVGNPSDPDLCNIISSALKEIIDVKNGPYALVFWSLHTDKLSIIKEYIELREKENIPSPLIIDTIDKAVVVNPQKFKDEIQRVLSNSTLEAMLDYEQKSLNAAARTINTIFSIVPKDTDTWGNTQYFEKNFDLILSKMAVESMGIGHAAKNPTLAVQNALSPLLQYNLHKESLCKVWDTKLISLKKSGKLVLPQNFKQGILNTTYHIDKEKNINKGERGAVLKVNLTSKKFSDLFGLSKVNFLKPYFDFRPKGRDDKQIEADSNKFLNKCEYVLIEISASCDYAQQNSRLFKYILGVKCTLDEYTSTKKSDYLYVTPTFTLNNKDFLVILNFRYVFGLRKSDAILGDVLFRFGENFTNLIGNKYSNYISRIGIVSII